MAVRYAAALGITAGMAVSYHRGGHGIKPPLTRRWPLHVDRVTCRGLPEAVPPVGPSPPDQAGTAVSMREGYRPPTFAGRKAHHLPDITLAEVRHHTSDDSLWVTYRGGVYDLSEFLALHPGGAPRLRQAAGGAIEPHWRQWPVHNCGEVRGLLERFRIGNVAGFDFAGSSVDAKRRSHFGSMFS